MNETTRQDSPDSAQAQSQSARATISDLDDPTYAETGIVVLAQNSDYLTWTECTICGEGFHALDFEMVCPGCKKEAMK